MEFLNIEKILASIVKFIEVEAVEILLSLGVIFFLGRIIIRISNQFVNEDRRRFKLKKSARYGTVIVMAIWMLLLYSNYTSNSDSFLIYIMGVFLAGIAFSMRDIFSNIVGWMIVASHNGYQSGDRIEIDEVRGDVIDVGVLRTTIAEIGDWDDRGEHSTGRLVSVPNSHILKEPVVNYNRGFETLWNEMSVVITFESDWQRAEKIIEDIAFREYEDNREKYRLMMQKVKRDFMVTYNYLSPKVYVTIIDSGVRLTLRHMVEVRKRRTANDHIFREILKHFNREQNVNFAYPTTRFYSESERSN